MKKKIISILLILMLILTNLTFAVEISKDDFKKSANEIFPKEIKITTEGGTSTFDIPGKVEVGDSTITIENEGEQAKIDYSIEENKIIYTSQNVLEVQFDENGDITSESGMTLVGHVFLYTDFMYRGFLTVADMLDIDYNVAVTYMQQLAQNQDEVEEDTGNEYIVKSSVTTDLYKYETEYNLVDKYSKFVYTINVDEFAKIDESLLTDGIIYNVSLSDVATSDEENNTMTNENTTITNTENTNTQTEMPKTGIKYETVYFLIGVIALCFIVGYRVYKVK